MAGGGAREDTVKCVCGNTGNEETGPRGGRRAWNQEHDWKKGSR